MVGDVATISVDATPIEVQNLKRMVNEVNQATEKLSAGFTMFAAARGFSKAELVGISDTEVSIKIPDEA